MLQDRAAGGTDSRARRGGHSADALLSLASAGLIILLAYGLPILGSLSQGAGETLIPDPLKLLKLALWTAGLLGGLILALQLITIREPLRFLLGNPGAPLATDLKHAAQLVLLLFAGVIVAQSATARLTGGEVPEVLRRIGEACRQDSLLAAVMFGPVVWIQAALVEELTRAFLIRRLSAVFSTPLGRALSIIGLSLIFGLAHIYQGWGGVAGTFVIGLVLGWGYLRWGRLLPIVLAHGVYDSLVLLGLLYLPHAQA
jgi:uncharacterized protein